MIFFCEYFDKIDVDQDRIAVDFNDTALVGNGRTGDITILRYSQLALNSPQFPPAMVMVNSCKENI